MDRTYVVPRAATRSFELIPRFLIALATALSLCGSISTASAGLLTLADTSAVAEPSAASGGSSGPGTTTTALSSGPHEKSGRTAFLASFLATTALGGAAWVVQASTGDQNHQSALGTTAVLGIAGYLAGPSIGHFYAGRNRRAWIGIGARGLIGLGFVASLVTLIDEGSANDQGPLSIAFMLVGAGAAVVDIVDAPRSARIHNERAGRVSIGSASVGGAPGVRVDVGF